MLDLEDFEKMFSAYQRHQVRSLSPHPHHCRLLSFLLYWTELLCVWNGGKPWRETMGRVFFYGFNVFKIEMRVKLNSWVIALAQTLVCSCCWH